MKFDLKTPMLFVFQAILILVPLTWTAATSELFEFPKMMLTYAGTIIIGALWLMRMASERKLIYRKTPFELPILAFLASQLISTLLSINPHTSWFGYYSRFNGGLLSLLCYAGLYFAAVSNFDRDDARTLVKTMLGAAVISSLYALPEHFGHSPSCQLISGEFHARCWVQNVQFRVFGTFGQPNWLAAYLISLIFLPLAYLTSEVKPAASRKNLGGLLVFLLFFLVLLFTKSKSGLIGFGTGLIIFAGLTLIQSRRAFKPLAVVAAALVITSFLFGKGIADTTDNIISKFQFSIFKTSEVKTPDGQKTSEVVSPPVANSLDISITPSSDIRRIVWKGALELAVKHPLFGTGVETFAYSYYNVRPVEHNLVSEWDFLYNKAHNEFLNYAATTGFIGLAAYLYFLGSFIVWSLHCVTSEVKPAEGSKNLGGLPDFEIPALLAGFISLCISNFFGFSTVPVNTLLFLVPSLGLLLTQEPQRLNRPQAEKTSEVNLAPPYLAYIIIGSLAVFLLAAVYRGWAADTAYAAGKSAEAANSFQTAVVSLQQAVKLVPTEPVYTDELSLTASDIAANLVATGHPAEASQAAAIAIDLSNRTIALNHVHLNFYKTRAKVFINLSAVNPGFAVEAGRALDAAIALAPTDAKLWLNRAVLTEQLGFKDEAVGIFQKTLELKPNYELGRYQFAKFLESLQRPAEAKAQYQYILDRLNPNNAQAKDGLTALATASATPR